MYVVFLQQTDIVKLFQRELI